MSNISLLNEEINGHFQTLESKYIEFIKEFNEFSDMKEKVLSGSRRDFNHMKEDITAKKNAISKLIETLNASKDYLEDADVSDKKTRTAVNKKLKMFNSKFPDKISEFENMANQLSDIQRKYSEEGSRISQGSENGSMSSINGDKVQIHDYKDTYLEQRQIEIENVKKCQRRWLKYQIA